MIKANSSGWFQVIIQKEIGFKRLKSKIIATDNIIKAVALIDKDKLADFFSKENTFVKEQLKAIIKGLK